VLRGAVRNLEENLHVLVAVWMQGGDGPETVVSSVGLHPTDSDREAVGWSFLSRRASGLGTETFAAGSMLHLPLKSAAMVEGVLSLAPTDGRAVPEGKRRMLETCAAHIAMALERARLATAAEEARLFKARESLERALLNSISHDLRSPLAAVTGVLSSLRDERAVLDDQARQELLETACGEAERLNRFVGNLLDMTRLEAGAVHLKSELCDVQELVGCALSAMEQRLGARRVEVMLAPDLPPVPMDLVLMIQVLVNLLDNAHKHAPPGSDIGLIGRVEEPWLVVEVVDRGPGVPEQDLQRIFDKFYRIPVPEGAGGTGLGLPICKGIIEAHGGMIRAGNRSGGGLKVEIRLPLPAEGSNDDAGT
jgi:two-component system sensor histidine kinase KdpD